MKRSTLQEFKGDPYRIVGSTFAGKYRLDEYAGGGGMGAVYRAFQIDSSRQVAIKILKPDIVIRNPEYADLFKREVRVVQQLDHPHIVKLLDSGTEEDISYMVMEWIEGITLEELLSKSLLSVDRIIHIFHQVCDAFAFAHKNNIIHLDVKPANILLLNNGQSSDYIKVIDFGMSRILTRESGTTVTRFLGTYQYCSPEHFGGKVSNRSDIYSLGVTLYHMISGLVPFGTSYIHAKRHPDLELPPAPTLRGIRPELPVAVDQVIKKALSKRPSERQESIEQLFEEFHKAVSSPSPQTQQKYSTGKRWFLKKAISRLSPIAVWQMSFQTRWLAGASLLLIIGLLSAITFNHRLTDSSDQNTQDSPPQVVSQSLLETLKIKEGEAAPKLPATRLDKALNSSDINRRASSYLSNNNRVQQLARPDSRRPSISLPEATRQSSKDIGDLDNTTTMPSVESMVSFNIAKCGSRTFKCNAPRCDCQDGIGCIAYDSQGNVIFSQTTFCESVQ